VDTNLLLSRFDLSIHGDRHERDFWPLLSNRFPSYELLWRQFVVPRTHRVDPTVLINDEAWIRLRDDVSAKDEQIAMAHYSVFYFTGRAVKRLSVEEDHSLEHPEDIFFLLNAASESLNKFLSGIEDLAKDQDRTVLPKNFIRFPKGFVPFEEVEAYRNALLHNAVLGRAANIKKTFLPRWDLDQRKSPLNRSEKSWRAAASVQPGELIETKLLFENLLKELFLQLEHHWQKALSILSTGAPARKIESMIDIASWTPPALQLLGSTTVPVAASGWFSPPEE
jgi:hypothetical protein